MKHYSSFPLRNVLAMQFIIIALAPILLAALFLFLLMIPQIKERDVSIAQIPFQIENKLNEQAELLLDLSVKLKDKLSTPPFTQSMPNSVMGNENIFNTIYLLNKNEQITLIFQQHNNLIKSKNSKAISIPASHIFSLDKNTTQAYWTDTFLSPVTNDHSCAYVIPFGDQLLIGEISSAQLSEILKKQDFPSLTILLDKKNRIVASNIETTSNETLASLLKNSFSAVPIHVEKPGLYKLEDFNIYGTQTIIRNIPWSLYIALPSHSFIENVRTYASFFFFCIATSFILALLSSFYFSRPLIRRILAYTKNIREIAGGSYPTIPVNDRVLEIAHFAQNLQEMSITIQEKENGSHKVMSHYLDTIKMIESVIVVLDPNLVITHVNEPSRNLFGLEPKNCIGRSFFEFVQPENINQMKERHARWIEQKLQSIVVEDKFIDSNKKLHTVLWNVTLNWDEDGHFTGYTGTGHEFSAWETMQEKLQLAALVYQKSAEAMVVINENNLIISVNPAFEEITGYTSNEVLFQNPSILGSALHNKLFYESIWNTLDTSNSWQGEVWNMRKNGELYAIRLTINTIRTSGKKIYRRIALFSDITEQKLTEKIIWQQNYFDSLTGLPNRNFLNRELSQIKRINIPTALMFLDLDRFKHINETHGYITGDLLLQETAHRLQNCTRKTDTIIRLGSDKFVILLRELPTLDEVKHIGKAILSELSEFFFINNAVIHLSANIGVAFYPDDATDVDDLLKNAEQAMRTAKREGKNALLYFTHSMQETAQARIQLINDLRQALTNQQFEIMYQPIVEIESGLIRKAEALIRWQHPVKGMINPAEFISIVEDTGMIASFGNWIFQEVASQARIWRNQFHPDFQISINISPSQFRSEGIDFINWISHLQELQLPGNGLVIEITEGLLLEQGDHFKQQLAAFKNAGMEIALDDFGVGYSSPSHLQNFNFDYIKIAPSFIKNLSQSDDSQALCEAIIVMAHKLKLSVIAEGIETIRQREILVETACDFGQGYLYSTPLPATELEQILENNYSLFSLSAQANIA
ncbi:MAG: EAL domain-containing protein [Betaproteobacteria bacterium]|nr:EAL domain-containing protein [Betaproteobacteria bacterium]